MKFSVHYWQHSGVSAVADEADVKLALEAYLQQYNVILSDAGRARITLTQLEQGFSPTDLDIICVVLCEYQFEAPEGTQPDSHDTNSDYAVSPRDDGEPELAAPQSLTPDELRILAMTAGELWDNINRERAAEYLSTAQLAVLARVNEMYRAEVGA